MVSVWASAHTEARANSSITPVLSYTEGHEFLPVALYRQSPTAESALIERRYNLCPLYRSASQPAMDQNFLCRHLIGLDVSLIVMYAMDAGQGS